MSRIKLLDEETIKQIAAGEVVERPSSAVKEIIENSIDAGSTKIVVKVNTNDYFSIFIEDNGHGIQKEDIEKVFINHATSKISTFQDLERLNTMGFRGEALASISAVSESVELITKNENDATGSRANCVKGKIEVSDFKKPSTGTIISVNNLFKNIPVRQKFLKSKSTEVRNIIETFINTALFFTNIHFELIVDKKTVLLLPKSKTLKDRIYDAFGSDISNKLISVNYKDDSLNIVGFLGTPEIFTQHKKIQYIYVNKRYVKNQIILSAIKKASTGLAHKDLNPVFFLNFELNSSKFDINVHPRKTEVKFENEQEIFLKIYKLTKQLLAQSLNPSLPSNVSDTINSKEMIINDEDRQKYSNSQIDSNLLTKERDTFFFKNQLNKSNRKIIDKGIEINRMLLQSLDNNHKYVDDKIYVSENRINYGSTENKVVKAFQIMKTYIVFEFNSQMYIVDQHAAAEKINFDLLIQNMGSIEKRSLLVPHIHEFTNKFEMDSFLSQLNEFLELGFEISVVGNNTIKIDSIPLIGDIKDISDLIDSATNQQENDFDLNYIGLNNLKITKSTYLRIATIACYSSLRAGQPLTDDEAVQLANKVINLKGPLTCPHGRPILIKYNPYELEKIFKRNL